MKIRGPLSVLLLVAAIRGQQTNSQTPEQEHAAMMRRGDAGMGFPQDKTSHRFTLLKDGGSIQVSANDPQDAVSRDHIRMHLSHVAEMFSAGDFDVPMFTHDTTPPGVPTMKNLRSQIHYRYEETERGGRVVIDSTNPKAVKAIHEFLRFQITEHKTGDPMKPVGADLKRE
jgi:hypothetical protein